jgi:hypothetical protein
MTLKALMRFLACGNTKISPSKSRFASSLAVGKSKIHPIHLKFKALLWYHAVKDEDGGEAGTGRGNKKGLNT